MKPVDITLTQLPNPFKGSISALVPCPFRAFLGKKFITPPSEGQGVKKRSVDCNRQRNEKNSERVTVSHPLTCHNSGSLTSKTFDRPTGHLIVNALKKGLTFRLQPLLHHAKGIYPHFDDPQLVHIRHPS